MAIVPTDIPPCPFAEYTIPLNGKKWCIVEGQCDGCPYGRHDPIPEIATNGEVNERKADYHEPN